MSTKELVLEFLEHNKGAFVSGAAIAQAIGVSRNSVWKAVQALERQGYAIESVTKKGYRLSQECDILSAASIESCLHTPDVYVEYHDVIDSTNNRAMALGSQGCTRTTVVVANAQTAGKGRQGRPFFSPAKTGIYFSLLIHPEFSVADAGLVTSYAAVCVARSIEELFGVKAQIKWVNDVFCNGLKCCGILTEASVCAETGGIDYLVVGIGINVAEPSEGFPDDIAGAAREADGSEDRDLRSQLVARVCDLFFEDYRNIPQRVHLEEYRKRSLLDGRTVHVFEGRNEYDALVLGVNDDFTLQVQLEDGAQRSLVSGEVHIPSSQL